MGRCRYLRSVSVFGRPFARCYHTVVCLPVTLVYCGQTVGRIKIKLGVEVGFGPGHIVSDGDPAPLPQRGTAPKFSAHVCCGQTAEWIKMPLSMEVGHGPGYIVLDGGPSRLKGGTAALFSARVYCGQTVAISATAEHLFGIFSWFSIWHWYFKLLLYRYRYSVFFHICIILSSSIAYMCMV